MTLKFLNECEFNSKRNITNIVLISKKSNLDQPSDFMPISLCDVIYKLVSKVIANRLKKIILAIISPN